MNDILSLSGSLIVTSICLYFIANQKSSWISGIIAMFFASLAHHFASQLLKGKPRLLISEYGITVDHWNSAMMPWRDFKSVSLKTIGKSEYLCFFLDDPEGFRRRANLIKRGIHTATRETGCGDILLDLSDFGLDAVGTAALVRRQVELAKTNPKPASAVEYPAVE